jgi:peroxiredoxin
MKLIRKNHVPELQGTDIFGHSFDLSSHRGKRIFLTFYRTAPCPFCNLRVHEVGKRTEAWKASGIITVGVFASSAKEILKYAGAQKSNFTILADPGFLLYDAFGIIKARMGLYKSMLRIGTLLTTMTKGFFSLNSLTDPPILPADFLIDEKGNIERAYYGEDFGDHLPLSDVERWASKKATNNQNK